MHRFLRTIILFLSSTLALQANEESDTRFFEGKIRPILVKHCYECHSEQSGTREGGLLLDRQSGWLQGGDSGKAVIPGEPNASKLIQAINYANEDLQMPPEYQLSKGDTALLKRWILKGAPGPKNDPGDTEFSRLGDQTLLFEKAETHWAFQEVAPVQPPRVTDPAWSQNAVDRFVFEALNTRQLSPSRSATPQVLLNRMSYDITGVPASYEQIQEFKGAIEKDRTAAVNEAIERLLNSPRFGEHIGRMWLDVARYADTDSAYRPDTRTPHYFPFAFTYRDYVIESFNADKPIDQFIKEQLAADLMGFAPDAPQQAAIGFLTVGPHVQRSQADAVDDWIDVTTRGLMGLTASCARCHDHKYEPIPTADYYSLHGVFASISRTAPLDEKNQPVLDHYRISESDRLDYKRKRAAVDAKIKGAGGKKARNNNRSIAQKIRETELAELLTFHPGAPVHTMIVKEKKLPVKQFIYVRGDARSRGDLVERRFLKVLDAEQSSFSADNSGRLELAHKIIDPKNPMTARVFVNRVWGMLMGGYLVKTPSDFGLQGSPPTHPALLDWLAIDFMEHGWATKHLVRTIVSSRTYQQSSRHRQDMSEMDPGNEFLWRANRKHLTIEAQRDSVLLVSGNLDESVGGRAERLWGEKYTRRRAIYGFINRFNLDPTLRVFDFPSPMQTHAQRNESIVAPQSLFTMNSPFVIDQAVSLTESSDFQKCTSDEGRTTTLFRKILHRNPVHPEITRISHFVEIQRPLFAKSKRKSDVTSPWPLVAQSLMMSNEFQYVD